jgi:hypothetical protein
MENQFTATSTETVKYAHTTIVGLVSTGEQSGEKLNNFWKNQPFRPRQEKELPLV